MRGLSLTDQEMNKATDLESKYSFYKKVVDPSMGEVTLLKANSGDEVICFKEQIKNSKDQFAQAILEARERLKLNHKYLIEMKDYSTRQKNDFCSTFYSIRTFYEYQMNNLQKEIKHRKDKGQDFSMIELTHLLYNITEAGSYLQDRGKSHGDIRPSSIAVLEEGKTYKLIDRGDANSASPMQAQLSYIFSGKEIYVTPQLYSALKKNNLKLNHNEYKSDVFSFGLCVLEAGLKRGIGSIYKDTSFDTQELERLLTEFGNKYEDNPLLVTTLRKMLSIEESERPDFKTILNAIPAYSEIIDYFEGEDQYYDNEGGEDFTQSNYPDQHHHGYGPNAGMHAGAHGGMQPGMQGGIQGGMQPGMQGGIQAIANQPQQSFGPNQPRNQQGFPNQQSNPNQQYNQMAYNPPPPSASAQHHQGVNAFGQAHTYNQAAPNHAYNQPTGLIHSHNQPNAHPQPNALAQIGFAGQGGSGSLLSPQVGPKSNLVNSNPQNSYSYQNLPQGGQAQQGFNQQQQFSGNLGIQAQPKPVAGGANSNFTTPQVPNANMYGGVSNQTQTGGFTNQTPPPAYTAQTTPYANNIQPSAPNTYIQAQQYTNPTPAPVSYPQPTATTGAYTAPFYQPPGSPNPQAGGYGQQPALTPANPPASPGYFPANNYAADASAEGEIKVVNGIRYREVKETKNEVNERGQTVKKITVKLVPLDDGVKKGPNAGPPVAVATNYNPGAQYMVPGQPIYR